MPTIFTKGDLLNTPDLHAYAHGVSCVGQMDSGISVTFKKRWPGLLPAFEQRSAERKLQLGEAFVWSEGGDTVYSLVIQENATKRPSLAALERSLAAMVTHAAGAGIARIGVPRVGAGKAGLEWLRVKSILVKVANDKPVTLVVYEQFVRAPGA
ncbi:macro domain-containing protein [Sorangium cellulosum]|uniref:macro domain-containing protein n=1 Tax=Sorangium cellulosum TaxID=56 RepID=UPI000CF54C80|nr:macro domain-containing protein [Sorangium cellulosum]